MLLLSDADLDSSALENTLEISDVGALNFTDGLPLGLALGFTLNAGIHCAVPLLLAATASSFSCGDILAMAFWDNPRSRSCRFR